jgi:hypothetical protein
MMNPNVSEAIARIKLAELHRQAAAARLARSLSSPSREAPEHRRVRAAIGSRLVRLGVRVGGQAATE